MKHVKRIEIIIDESHYGHVDIQLQRLANINPGQYTNKFNGKPQNKEHHDDAETHDGNRGGS